MIQLTSDTANSTYSIDLSTYWTYGNVQLNRIPKQNLPPLNTENLWLDPSESFIYAYNGDVSWVVPQSEQAPPSQLFKFTPNGNDGSWEQLASVSIDRATGTLGAYGNGLGYAVGGWKSSHTDSGLGSATISVPGVVEYNMTSGSWRNISDSNAIEFADVREGISYLLDDFGQSGLLLTMGGTKGDTGSLTFNSFQNVTLFDPVTNSWSNQTTSGTVPVGRTHACSVMVKGDKNTYEVLTKSCLSTVDSDN